MQLYKRYAHLRREQGSDLGQSNSTATNACFVILYFSSHSLWSGIQFTAVIRVQQIHHVLHCKHTGICTVEKVDGDICWSRSKISVTSLYIS